MRAGPDVDEGDGPEADHRQPVAVQRRLGGLGDEVVGDAEPERRKDQADGVVHVEPVEVRLIDARVKSVAKLPVDVDECRPENGAHDVPDRGVHLLVLARRTVAKMLTRNITHATTTRTSSDSGSSAYSRPWFYPAASVTTAARMMTSQRTAVATPSFSLQSFMPQSRGTR